MKADDATQGVRDGLNLRPRVADIGHGDVIAVGIRDPRRVHRARPLRPILNHCSVRIIGLSGNHYAVQAGFVSIVNEGAVSSVSSENRGIVVRVVGHRSRKAVARAVGVHDHAAIVHAESDDLAKSQRPARCRPVPIYVKVDVRSGFIPDTRVVGEAKPHINAAPR